MNPAAAAPIRRLMKEQAAIRIGSFLAVDLDDNEVSGPFKSARAARAWIARSGKKAWEVETDFETRESIERRGNFGRYMILQGITEIHQTPWGTDSHAIREITSN
ncbi:MAG TPA: hypothetical protein VIM61_01400 [Chthoniobacterales bacterium]